MARYTCDTCAHDCSSMADFDAHLAEIARRRRLYGATWALDSLKGQYHPLDGADDVETAPQLAYTRAEYRDEGA